ncbi:hypothetical protein BDC45DRAFT_560821 [Circinella umbellata]|nr:hypothetical protein BDC45DRAFT_560821 [Circinella umbellata]
MNLKIDNCKLELTGFAMFSYGIATWSGEYSLCLFHGDFSHVYFTRACLTHVISLWFHQRLPSYVLTPRLTSGPVICFVYYLVFRVHSMYLRLSSHSSNLLLPSWVPQGRLFEN